MRREYQKICIEKNDYYKVYHGAGIYVCSEQSAELHCDSDITITYFKECDAVLKVEGKQYTVKSGDVVLMNPGEVHCCTVADGSFHERISLYVKKSIMSGFPFDSEALFDRFYNSGDSGNLIPAVIAKNSIHHIMERILYLSENKDRQSRILCVCGIVELLTELNEAAAYRLNLSAEDPTVAAVIEYIGASFAKNITCEQIAERFYISKFRLEHIFREYVGVSLWEYVILRRIMLVNELLRKGRAVNDAASEAGFRNYSNFYRLYKKHMGITPLEYKRQYYK